MVIIVTIDIHQKLKEVTRMIETESKHIKLPVTMIKDIIQFQKDNYIQHFTQAVVELIRRALETEYKKSQ